MGRLLGVVNLSHAIRLITSWWPHSLERAGSAHALGTLETSKIRYDASIWYPEPSYIYFQTGVADTQSACPGSKLIHQPARHRKLSIVRIRPVLNDRVQYS